jgi:chlorobactene glucosyltransferase
LGKPYACSVGAKAVTTKWILFADADTWYEPGVLESLIQAAEADNLSFLSLHPVMECQGVAEHILTPYCQALYFAAVNPQTCPEGAFDGHCVLVRREAYEFIGGHASNSSFLVDDLKLALLAQRHRMKLGLVRTSRLAHARFHRGWSGMWEGLARNGFKLSLLPVSIWLVTLLLMMVAALWLPMVVLEFVMSWTALAAVLLVLPILLLLSWYRNPMQALLAPLAFYAMLPMAGHALYCVIASHRVSWKGRGVS